MPDLPTGTVTFLFTDVEGSTRLWEQQPSAMRRALVRHDAIVEQAVAAHAGVMVRPRGEGDSRFAVFARSSDALAAAVAIQQALHTEPWPTASPLRVRMALHTGEADLRAGDYYGPAVNRCARLRALAHGGQALLSQATYDLVRDESPPGASLRDLGEQRLSDLSRPERVFQLLQPSVPGDFPPLRSLDVLPNNLPLQLTTFVGRERELLEVKQALETTRLLTLTGTGGCGKTRLALQAAAELVERCPDGVWLVELAPLADATLVASSVAAVLAIPAQPGQPVETTLVHALRAKRLLLLLDNCEHLLDACARLADGLLHGCAGLTILATSREALGIAGETSRRVPSLALPSPDSAVSMDQVAECEAIRLFVDRALAVQPSFAVTAQNAAAVAQLCRRLDGIPLALELAAARTKALGVDQLAARLDQRFRLLTGGSRTALPRQQTLRAAIDWSYELLDDQERTLFQWLSVFAGGWALEAAEGVCSDEAIGPEDVLDLLARLVDKSLVLAEEQQTGRVRYRLLETLRQYGREKLQASGEAETRYDRHADYFAELAAATTAQVQSAGQIDALDRLEAEDANLRQALEWLIARGDGELAVRLVTGQSSLWLYRSRHADAPQTLQRALATPGAGLATRASALTWLGMFFWMQAVRPAERATARRSAEEAFALASQSGDPAVVAWACFGLGYTGGDPADQLRQYAVALEHYRRLDDPFGTALVTQRCAVAALQRRDERATDRFLAESGRLWRELPHPYGLGEHRWLLGLRALQRGDPPAAHEHLEQARRLWEAVGYRWGLATLRRELGRVAQARGDLATARRLMEQSLADYRDNKTPRHVALALIELAEVLLEQGEGPQGRRLLTEALQLTVTARFLDWTARALEVLARAEAQQGRPERALRWAGAATAWRERERYPLINVFERRRLDQALAEARAAVGDAAADAAIAAGRRLTPDQAAAEELREGADG